MKLVTFKNFLMVGGLAFVVLMGTSYQVRAQGHGRGQSKQDKKCAKFVNCHDASEGRVDGRGPRRASDDDNDNDNDNNNDDRSWRHDRRDRDSDNDDRSWRHNRRDRDSDNSSDHRRRRRHHHRDRDRDRSDNWRDRNRDTRRNETGSGRVR